MFSGILNQLLREYPNDYTDCMFGSCKRKGNAGERLLGAALRLRRYEVYQPSPIGDLKVLHRQTGIILFVEVKTAGISVDGKYRFTLRKDGNGTGHTDHRGTDLVVLLSVMPTGLIVPFVIPTMALLKLRVACISSDPRKYRGKLSVYRQSMQGLDLHSILTR